MLIDSKDVQMSKGGFFRPFCHGKDKKLNVFRAPVAGAQNTAHWHCVYKKDAISNIIFKEEEKGTPYGVSYSFRR